MSKPKSKCSANHPGANRFDNTTRLKISGSYEACFHCGWYVNIYDVLIQTFQIFYTSQTISFTDIVQIHKEGKIASLIGVEVIFTINCYK
jgi:hypothetical protein